MSKKGMPRTTNVCACCQLLNAFSPRSRSLLTFLRRGAQCTSARVSREHVLLVVGLRGRALVAQPFAVRTRGDAQARDVEPAGTRALARHPRHVRLRTAG